MYQWEEKYSVGIQSIDAQHQEVFKLLNSLLLAMKEGQASRVTTQIILELEKYASIHFQKEEFFFQRFNYSEAAEHIREHQLFLQKVVKLKAEFKSGKITLTFDLLNFLKDWIDHHIEEVDKKYMDCFKLNGLK
jgi:methyl-accepting chemotaxis protein/hemerythrin